MSSRGIGFGAIVLGGILLVVALTADITGVGDKTTSEIGLRQGAAIAAGAIVLIVGLVVVFRTGKPDESEPPD